MHQLTIQKVCQPVLSQVMHLGELSLIQQFSLDHLHQLHRPHQRSNIKLIKNNLSNVCMFSSTFYKRDFSFLLPQFQGVFIIINHTTHIIDINFTGQLYTVINLLRDFPLSSLGQAKYSATKYYHA